MPTLTRRSEDIVAGWEIPTATYSDQPYIVKTDDGAWLCCVTTGAGHEGAAGPGGDACAARSRPHLVAARGCRARRAGPEASSTVMLKAPGGPRLHLLQPQQRQRARGHRRPGPATPTASAVAWIRSATSSSRSPTTGAEPGPTQRYDIPMRDDGDRPAEPLRRQAAFFWNVGKPFVHAGSAYVSLHKVGGFGEGFFTRSEGVLLQEPQSAHRDAIPRRSRGRRCPGVK